MFKRTAYQRDIDAAAKEFDCNELKRSQEEAKNFDRGPASCCTCGWNGKVDWNAHGQKCPNCGQLLT